MRHNYVFSYAVELSDLGLTLKYISRASNVAKPPFLLLKNFQIYYFRAGC